jgi:hypothetical protein
MVKERFLNAALFFNEKTKKMDTIKLYKLLFLADRNCIRRTGHTITESPYRKITPWGPVPVEVKALIDGMASGDIVEEKISSRLKVEKQGKNTHISLNGKPDLDYFSKDEILILEELARKYTHRDGKSIAHGVHRMRGVDGMDWEKQFDMDVFLPPLEREQNRKHQATSDRFKMFLDHA